MAEGKEYTRRDFLKMSSAAFVSTLIPKKVFDVANSIAENSEALKTNEVSLAALRVIPERNEDGLKHGFRVLNQIEKVLNETPTDLLITPEYSFHMSYVSEKRSKPRPLVIHQEQNSFVVDKTESSSATRMIIERAQLLAKNHKTNLFLSSFYDPSHPNSDSPEWATMAVFIDKNGEITGVKRKFLPPNGKFEITQGEKTLKILPLLCGEAWREMKDDKSTPPEWVKKNAPYDVLIHSLRQGDLNFDDLATFVQKRGEGLSQSAKSREGWQKDTFNVYYSEYFKFLKPSAPILVSDVDMAGCFNQDLSPIKGYSDNKDYILAKIDTSQLK